MAAIDIDGGVPATTLSSSINSGDTSIPVTDGTGYPSGAGGNFYIVIDRGLSSQEVIECSARSGNTVTAATRGADGSSAASHASGAAVEHVVPASELQAMSTHRNATTGTPHGSAYLTTTSHASVSHTTAMIGDDQITDAKLATGISASKLTGTASVDTSGNAATADVADAWSTARDISFTGDVTGTVTGLDGSSNESAGLTIAVAGSAWTPQLNQDDDITSTVTHARYMRLGKLLIAWFNISATAAGSAGNAIEIQDLPVAAASADGIAGWARYNDSTGATANYNAFLYGQSTTSVRFRQEGTTSPLGTVGGGVTVASGDLIQGVLVYETA
jgi:hypothetical protein